MSRTLPSRRAVLSLGAAAVVTGCRFDPSPSAAPRATPSPDPDRTLVLAARAELTTLISRLSAGTGTAALVACHRAQHAAIGGHPPPITRRSAPLTPAQVVAHEHRAGARFTQWAATCSSGDLARVLASIAAGIAMQPAFRTSAS